MIWVLIISKGLAEIQTVDLPVQVKKEARTFRLSPIDHEDPPCGQIVLREFFFQRCVLFITEIQTEWDGIFIVVAFSHYF